LHFLVSGVPTQVTLRRSVASNVCVRFTVDFHFAGDGAVLVVAGSRSISSTAFFRHLDCLSFFVFLLVLGCWWMMRAAAAAVIASGRDCGAYAILFLELNIVA
jgi:hypothetical protein